MSITISPLLWPPQSKVVSFMPSVISPQIHWTGAANFRSYPKVTYNGFLPAKGTFTVQSIASKPQKSIINLEDGFTYTGTRLTYLSVPEDVKKAVYIQWMLERPFQESTGDFVTSSYLRGRLTLPANSAAFLRLVTQELRRDVSAAILRTNIYKSSIKEQTFPITPKPVSKLYKHIDVNSDTVLRQILTVAIVIGTAEEKFILDISQAAESTITNSITSESATILDTDVIF